MKTFRAFLLIALFAFCISCNKVSIPHTDNTRALIRELFEKLDSVEFYAARRDSGIEAIKSRLSENIGTNEKYDLLCIIGEKYATYVIDSSLLYFRKASELAQDIRQDSLLIRAEINRSSVLTVGGFYVAAKEALESLPRKDIKGDVLSLYYNAWSGLYHELYSSYLEPDDLKEKYRAKYNIYRDSLLAISDINSMVYLRNMERKEARAGNFDQARIYNNIRQSKIDDKTSNLYASCLYDRYVIDAYYCGVLTGEAVDNLLKSAIIEVREANYNISSLHRIESLLSDISKHKDAKKISDYYYSSLRYFGSRKRILEGGEFAIDINNKHISTLQKKNREIVVSIIFISFLVIALVFALIMINKYVTRVNALNEKLRMTSKMSKNYVGIVFQLYSSYIKQLGMFRSKIHTALKRGSVDLALELTSPSGESSSEERKMLFRNFDSAFIDIFPEFIEIVNSCLKPEEKIVPKKTEILNNELRILALIKLGIEDSKEIANLLHCSIKTVYNLRSNFKSRLSVSEDEFNHTISQI